MNLLKPILVVCFLLVGQLTVCQSQKGIWHGSPMWPAQLWTQKRVFKNWSETAKPMVSTKSMLSFGIAAIPSTQSNHGKGIRKKVTPRFANRDMLQELIDEAHSEGLQVHAWFEFGFSSSYQEEDGGHILRTKPNWKAIDNQGKLVAKNGFQWMNAFGPEVQFFLLSLITEVIEKYDIDGIQGDDRLPANPSTAGYDALKVALYQREHSGNSPPQNYKDSLWVDWRPKN